MAAQLKDGWSAVDSSNNLANGVYRYFHTLMVGNLIERELGRINACRAEFTVLAGVHRFDLDSLSELYHSLERVGQTGETVLPKFDESESFGAAGTACDSFGPARTRMGPLAQSVTAGALCGKHIIREQASNHQWIEISLTIGASNFMDLARKHL